MSLDRVMLEVFKSREYRERLFEKEPIISETDFLSIARSIGEDPHQIRTELQKFYLSTIISNCKNLTLGGGLTYIEDYYNKTGIKPELPTDIVQKIYMIYILIGKDRWLSHKSLSRLINVIGIKPAEEIVQIGYSAYLLEDGEKQKFYEEFVNAIKSIGTNKSSDDLITAAIFSQCDIHSNRLDNIKTLEEITGIKPNLPEDFLQQRYRIFILKGELDVVEYLISKTEIKPSDDIVQECFRVYLEEKKPKVGEDFPKEQGINIAYDVIIRKRFSLLRKLKDITGIKPNLPDEVIQQIYAKFAEKGRLDRIKELSNILEVRPSDNVYRLIKNFLK